MDNPAGRMISRSIKAVAIAVSSPLALLGAMALVGQFVVNGWARLAIAAIALIAIPAFLADRLLPDDPTKSRGVVTDVLAVCWLGFAFVVFGAAIALTQPAIDQEARRLEGAEMNTVAKLTRWLAGGKPTMAFAAEPGALEPSGPAEDAGAKNVPAPSKIDAGSADAGGETASNPEDSKPLNPEELFNRWSGSVVTIRVTAGAFRDGGGTGFIIDNAGTVITNHHVVGESTAVSIKLKDGSWVDRVDLLHRDKDRDVAILRISPAEELVPTLLGDSDDVKVGEKVISIGNPLGLEHTLTDGLISARRKVEGKRMIQSTAPISPGNSGGPLFNLRGEVIGVMTASFHSFRGAQNLNLAIPINDVKEMLKSDYPDVKRIGGGGPDKGTW